MHQVLWGSDKNCRSSNLKKFDDIQTSITSSGANKVSATIRSSSWTNVVCSNQTQLYAQHIHNDCKQTNVQTKIYKFVFIYCYVLMLAHIWARYALVANVGPSIQLPCGHISKTKQDRSIVTMKWHYRFSCCIQSFLSRPLLSRLMADRVGRMLEQSGSCRAGMSCTWA